jgi:hypothetical protein
MRDGAIDGMSFRFSVVQEEWNKPKRGLPERTITELKLFEFGPVTFPAYEATSVGIRSRGDFAEWRGLTDAQREEIRNIVHSTRTTEPAEGTSDGEARSEDPEDPAPSHSEAPQQPSEHRRAWLIVQAKSAGALT